MMDGRVEHEYPGVYSRRAAFGLARNNKEYQIKVLTF
jgi:hypothetical protein